MVVGPDFEGVLGGAAAFWRFTDALMLDEEGFAFADVDTYDLTRRQVYEKLADIATSECDLDRGLILDLLALPKEALAKGEKNPGSHVTKQLKWYVKYGRMLGIHVSPTTTLNGLGFDSSSSWTMEQWVEALDPVVNAPTPTPP